MSGEVNPHLCFRQLPRFQLRPSWFSQNYRTEPCTEIIIIIIIIIIILFGDTVTVTHLTKCNTYSKVSSVAKIFAPPPPCKQLVWAPGQGVTATTSSWRAPGGPLAGPFSPAAPPPRSRGLRGPRYATVKSASHVSHVKPTTPFLQGAFHLTQPHPHARKRKHGRSLTVMPWTTTDEFKVIPRTQRMSSASFPGLGARACYMVIHRGLTVNQQIPSMK